MDEDLAALGGVLAANLTTPPCNQPASRTVNPAQQNRKLAAGQRNERAR